MRSKSNEFFIINNTTKNNPIINNNFNNIFQNNSSLTNGLNLNKNIQLNNSTLTNGLNLNIKKNLTTQNLNNSKSNNFHIIEDRRKKNLSNYEILNNFHDDKSYNIIEPKKDSEKEAQGYLAKLNYNNFYKERERLISPKNKFKK